MSDDKLRPRVVWILANTTWSIYNFRRRLILALREAGYDVVICSPPDDYVGRIEALGVRHVPLHMRNSSIGPMRELVTLVRLIALIWRERPTALLSFTPKVNMYAGIAARLTGIPILMNISGLGRGFSSGPTLRRISEGLYRLAARRAHRMLFQNEDDRAHFIDKGITEAVRTERLPGSGVDLERFTPTPRPPASNLRFLMATRLLRDKGVVEFVSAASVLAPRYSLARFRLVGFLGIGDPNAVTANELSRWQAEGLIEYGGPTDRIEDELAQADCLVLPSYYREGVPRILLEAAASGLPIITTDFTGCRDAVEAGVTGLLCPPRDVAALTDAMARIIQMDGEERRAMGAAGRRKVEQEFDERIVIGRYLDLLSDIMTASASNRSPVPSPPERAGPLTANPSRAASSKDSRNHS